MYQFVDEIWGFAPSLVLLCCLMAMACPVGQEPVAEAGQRGTIAMPRSVALLGLSLITAFFLLAGREPFIQGQPARSSCMMGFISPALQKQVPRGIARYQLLPDDSSSFRPVLPGERGDLQGVTRTRWVVVTTPSGCTSITAQVCTPGT